MIVYYLIGILGVIFDFFTKKAAVKYLKDAPDMVIIEDVFHLSYVENRGAAFGILANQRYVFIVLTVVIIATLIWWLHKKKPEGILMKLGATLVISGAVGNFIDRVFLGYVVDFLNFCLINFPVFNVADCLVCSGAFLIALYYLFFDKENTGRIEEEE